MSYINKEGKTTAWKKMVTRQQISDLLIYGTISTTLSRAKATQKYAERLITVAKVDSVANRRFASAILLNTKILKKQDLIDYLFTKVAIKFKNHNGGYTRIVKAGPRRGDASEVYILQFVIPLIASKTFGNKQTNGKILGVKVIEKNKKDKDNMTKTVKKSTSSNKNKSVSKKTVQTKKPVSKPATNKKVVATAKKTVKKSSTKPVAKKTTKKR